MSREDVHREMARITIEKARKRNLPLKALSFYDGSYYYPKKKVRDAMTPYEINDVNRLLIYYIPENGKWCCGYDFSFYDHKGRCLKKYQEPTPMKGRLYDTWSGAVGEGLHLFADFTTECVENVDRNPDFYGYLDNFG